MAELGSVFVRLGIKDNASKEVKGIFKGIRGQMLKFGLAFGALNFFKHGVKAASDFQENWSVVMAAVDKNTQEQFLKGFRQLKRTSKAEFSDIAVTMIGIMKQKGIKDSVIGQLGPEVIKRLEDTASTFNATMDQTVGAFSSMMAGQAKPIKMLTKDAVIPLVANLDILSQQQYGINFENLAPDEQVLLRLKFFMDQTAKYPALVGNSSKYLYTYKGRMDAFKKSTSDASASIAKNLMPTLAKLLQVLAKVSQFIARNQRLVIGLAGAYAGFKLGSFIGQIAKAIALLMSLTAAKVAAQTGVGAIVAVPMVLGAVGAIIGGITAAHYLGGSVGSSGSTSTPKNNNPTFVVTMDPLSGRAQATSNGNNITPYNNPGRGGN